MSTQEPSEPIPDMLTTGEARTVSRLSRSNFYRKLRAGDIPSVRVGRKILIREKDLLKLLTPTEAA